ncbi:prefoldin subunit 4 [[Candida] jaroonii]|uniref:Prefoldin subunit 4 n=1 Tax=[Candida] jaroonii TaxID=467808 RepID=A0ACA9Y5R0_9ASCO|nr:prefoldin subunit 4 [[Candida] jaroonii]
MELLPEGQKNSIQVLWEDQQKINRFSSLINAKDELSSKLEKLKTEKDYIDDLSLELELVDEDEKIQYKFGDGFIFLKAEQVLEKIDKTNTDLTSKIEDAESKIDDLNDQLNELKTDLYAKFGKNINLER